MKKINEVHLLMSLAIMCVSIARISAQAPSKLWQRCLGGSGSDGAVSVVQTDDGGFVTAGFTSSNNIYVSGNNGGGDYWIAKQDASGAFLWQKCYGGSNADNAFAMKQTSDNGFIVAGGVISNDGFVSGNHGSLDAWIIKLDSAGNLQWQRAFGGTGIDVAYDIIELSTGDFVFCGTSYSSDGDVIVNRGGSDFWVIKLNASGSIKWIKNLGGSGNEAAYSLAETAGGGLVIAGFTESNDGDVSGNHGGKDFWIVKINSNDQFAWQKCFGGTLDETAYSVIQGADGNLLAAGYAMSSDGNLTGNRGGKDFWIIKFNASNLQWQKNYGGSMDESASAIRQTGNGGYIVAGYSDSNDGNVSGNHGLSDIWVLNISASGNSRWKKCYGGSGSENISYEKLTDIQQTADGGYILAGITTSNDGDVSGWLGNKDFWTLRLSGDCPDKPKNPVTSNITSTSAKLSWDIVPAALSYQIKYREVGTSVWILKYTSQNFRSKTLTGLAASTTYEWKVRAKCASGPNIFSRFSETEMFTTLVLRNGIEQERDLTANVNLVLYPVPAKQSLNILLDNESFEKGSCNAEIISLTGQTLLKEEFSLNELSGGVTMNVSGLNSGLYIFKVSTGSTVIHRMFKKD